MNADTFTTKQGVRKKGEHVSLSKLLEQRKLTNEILEAGGGELTPEQFSALEILERELATKPDAIASVLNEFSLVVSDLKKKKSDLDAAIKSIERQFERLEQYTIENMLNHELKELEGEDVVLKLSPTRGSVKIKDKALAEQLYGEEEVTVKVSLDRIRKDLDSSIDLGVAIIEQGWSLKSKIKRSKK